MDRSGAAKVCCIGPSREVWEELTPALMRCLPGAAMSDIRHYPPAASLEGELRGMEGSLFFVDVISDKNRALAVIPQVLQLAAGAGIIVLLEANDPDLILKSLRLGATEFLIRPFSSEQLQTALSKLVGQIRVDGAGDKGGGRVYCAIPAKGACGASTVACNIAFDWKRMGIGRVLLADLDPLTGTLSFLLKLKSSFSFLDVLNRAESLDADLWKAMITKSNGVDVLLAPEMPLEGISEVRDAGPIISYARKNYDNVILDASSAYGEWNVSIAAGSDEILLITSNELPALQGAQRVLVYLDAHDIPRSKVHVVVNRYDREIGLSREVIASALHTDVLEVIPSDYETVQQALLDGKPVPPASIIGKRIAHLARQLTPDDKPADKKAAPLGGILSLFSRLSS
jgi:pilus assembly protein CpaE